MSLEHWLDTGGQVRALGNNPSPMEYRSIGAGQLPDIPESEWREFDLREVPGYPVKVKDQGNYGACNGHAAASSLEIARFIAGYGHHDLSAWMVYADLCQGIDRGSNIAQALVHLKDKGTCRGELVLHGTINPTRIMPVARTDAKRFRIEIGYRLETFRDLCIASQLMQPFNFSIPVNSDFNTLDAEGCPRNRPGAHNHAVTGGLAMKKMANGKWKIGWLNSWSTRWGQGGYAWLAEHNVDGYYWDAYSVQATHYDPEDGILPVLA